MSSLWTIGGVEVFVDGETINTKNIFAELNVLDVASSEFHWYGAKSDEYTLKGHVLSETNKDALKALAISSSSVTLVSDQGTVGSFIVTTVNLTRKEAACGVHVAGYPVYDTTVYEFKITLRPASGGG